MMKNLELFLVGIFLLIAIPSCKDDQCENVLCQNGGVCQDGVCSCPEGFVGDSCETQIEIGINYGGGLVFHIFEPGDPEYIAGETHGLIVTATDIGTFEWGCSQQDIDGVENIMQLNGAVEASGDGRTNTLAILSECPDAPAALACVNYNDGTYDDWFLPSIKELELIRINLHQTGIGDFNKIFYWSSTEYSNEYAWRWLFDQIAADFNNKKDVNINVLPIRQF